MKDKTARKKVFRTVELRSLKSNIRACIVLIEYLLQRMGTRMKIGTERDHLKNGKPGNIFDFPNISEG
jgi:hypothetical protein